MDDWMADWLAGWQACARMRVECKKRKKKRSERTSDILFTLYFGLFSSLALQNLQLFSCFSCNKSLEWNLKPLGLLLLAVSSRLVSWLAHENVSIAICCVISSRRDLSNSISSGSCLRRLDGILLFWSWSIKPRVEPGSEWTSIFSEKNRHATPHQTYD